MGMNQETKGSIVGTLHHDVFKNYILVLYIPDTTEEIAIICK